MQFHIVMSNASVSKNWNNGTETEAAARKSQGFVLLLSIVYGSCMRNVTIDK